LMKFVVLLRSMLRSFGLYYTENAAFDFLLHLSRYISAQVGREFLRAQIEHKKN
jgi:hypothetical protein